MKKLRLVFLVLFAVVAFQAASADAGCTQGWTTSGKSEFLQGIHDAADTYKMALYTQAAASLGPTTTVYSVTGEVTGTGYTAGGATMTGFSVTTSGTTAILDWTTDPSWSNASITADCYEIYNSSKSNKVIYVGTMTSTTSTNDTFRVVGPTPDASNGWMRIQ